MPPVFPWFTDFVVFLQDIANPKAFSGHFLLLVERGSIRLSPSTWAQPGPLNTGIHLRSKKSDASASLFLS
jgi:hypothetical protein